MKLAEPYFGAVVAEDNKDMIYNLGANALQLTSTECLETTQAQYLR